MCIKTVINRMIKKINCAINAIKEINSLTVGMLTGTRVPGTRIYYPNPGS